MITLEEYLATRTEPKFRPEPQYYREGDYMTYFARDEIYHAERIDGLLTIYWSDRTGEFLGCKIKGVRRMVERIGTMFLL